MKINKEDLKNGQHLYKHGLYKTKLYHVWEKMKSRCNNPSNRNYPDYGGRGIFIGNEWNDFLPFYQWSLKNGYKEGLTIDRINNDGGYSPDNCRWITRTENANNKRNNHWIEWNGENKTVAQWARLLDMKYATLFARLFISKMSLDEAMTREVK